MRRFSKRHRSFTLIEVLVSIAVMSLLILMCTALLSSGSLTLTNQMKHQDSKNSAQLVFSLMAEDFNALLRRNDVSSLFSSNSGNDSFYFFSETTVRFDPNSAAYTADLSNPELKNTVSLVGYRINGNYQLERLGKALNFQGANSATPTYAIFATNAGVYPAATTNVNYIATSWAGTVGTSPSFTGGTDADYHVLSSDIFRLEFCFLLTNGTYATVHSNPDFSDVAAVVVTLGVLDSTSQKAISATLTNNLSTAVNTLADTGASLLSTTPPTLPAQSWGSTVTTQTPTSPQFYKNIRIYQRYFYLTQNP